MIAIWQGKANCRVSAIASEIAFDKHLTDAGHGL